MSGLSRFRVNVRSLYQHGIRETEKASFFFFFFFFFFGGGGGGGGVGWGGWINLSVSPLDYFAIH